MMGRAAINRRRHHESAMVSHVVPARRLQASVANSAVVAPAWVDLVWVDLSVAICNHRVVVVVQMATKAIGVADPWADPVWVNQTT